MPESEEIQKWDPEEMYDIPERTVIIKYTDTAFEKPQLVLGGKALILFYLNTKRSG